MARITTRAGGVHHDQGEVYQKPITFRRVSQSGQVEIKIECLYHIPNIVKRLGLGLGMGLGIENRESKQSQC